MELEKIGNLLCCVPKDGLGLSESVAIDALTFFYFEKNAFRRSVVGRRLLIPHRIEHENLADLMLEITGWRKLRNNANFLQVAPHEWASFTEPQITNGWVYFLAQGNSLARCRAAFESAFGITGREAPKGLSRIEVLEAERDDMDILIVASRRDGSQVLLCIEAKFGHQLTGDESGEGQLEKYRKKIDEKYKGINRCLLVLGSNYKSNKKQLVDNPEWRFRDWKSWLIHFDSALSPENDDDDFRRFRRTVLLKHYQEAADE